MVDKFEFLKSFNNEIYKNCKTAEFLINVMENFNSSLSSARIALELLCAEENPSHYQYDSLDEKVRSFVSRTNPDDNIFNALKTIKTKGNEGSHGNGSTRKAKDAIELLEQVLIWYVCGYRGKKYKESDFHPSELRYAYLYCKDLKSNLAKPEKAANGKKVVVEEKNNVVQKNAISISENKSDKSTTTSAPEAAPIPSAIDKEEKKRLKLERKAQEEAERKAKRNAEREIRKQLQKEQKAKALEEARRRNEEAVAKANAKLQTQEDKKLAKEKELEQKRIRAEQRELRLEQKRIALEENLRKQKEAELIKQQKKEEKYRKEREESIKSFEDAKRASRESWEKQQQELKELHEKVNNPFNSILNVLVDAYVDGNSQVLKIFLEYRNKVNLEKLLLISIDHDLIQQVHSVLKNRDYENIPYDEFFELTKCYSDIVLKLCLDIFLVLEHNHHAIEGNYDFYYIRDTLVCRFKELREDDAKTKYDNAKLYSICDTLYQLKTDCEDHYQETMEKILSSMK